MDFSSTFVLLLAAAGVILLADRMFFKARRQRGADGAAAGEGAFVRSRRWFTTRAHSSRYSHRAAGPFLRIRTVSDSLRVHDAGIGRRGFHPRGQFSYGLRLPVTNTKYCPSASRGGATSSCSGCRRIRPSTSSNGWLDCRETTSWCATTGSPSTDVLVPLQPDGVYSRGLWLHGRANLGWSASARNSM